MLRYFKCVLCSVLINVHELVLKMNVENIHGEKIKKKLITENNLFDRQDFSIPEPYKRMLMKFSNCCALKPAGDFCFHCTYL